jgi:hypothetical protein
VALKCVAASSVCMAPAAMAFSCDFESSDLISSHESCTVGAAVNGKSATGLMAVEGLKGLKAGSVRQRAECMVYCPAYIRTTAYSDRPCSRRQK